MEQLTNLARRTDYCALRLADEMHLERRTMARRFRVELNSSPGEWLARQRMRDAVELIDLGFTIKEVAAALGYRQTPQFCREFRRRLGCTPSEYASQRRDSAKLVLEAADSPRMSQTAHLLSQTANAPNLPLARAA